MIGTRGKQCVPRHDRTTKAENEILPVTDKPASLVVVVGSFESQTLFFAGISGFSHDGSTPPQTNNIRRQPLFGSAFLFFLLLGGVAVQRRTFFGDPQSCGGLVG